MERVYTLDVVPEGAEEMRRLGREVWPEFLHHGDVEHWRELFDSLAPFQLVVYDDVRVVGIAHTAPIEWTGEAGDLPKTIEEILLRSIGLAETGRAATDLCALAAIVDPSHRGRGLSRRLVGSMIALAARRGLRSLLAPVRPVEKEWHPFVPMDEYIGWTLPSGRAFDPWLRVHLELGGTILQVAPATLRVEGSVAEWEGWTGLRFGESGPQAVPGALNPVQIDRDRDVGVYEEPNVWVRHEVGR